MTSRSCVLWTNAQSHTPVRCALFCPETPPAPLERRSARRKARFYGLEQLQRVRSGDSGSCAAYDPAGPPPARLSRRPVRSAACLMWTPGVHLVPVLSRSCPFRRENPEVFQQVGRVQVPLPALVRTPPCRAWEDGGRLGPRSETFHFAAGFQGPFRVLSGHPTHARNAAEVVVSQTFTSSCRVPRRRAAAQFESPPSACQIAYLQRRSFLVPVLGRAGPRSAPAP
jgi:hypothetical protein